MAEIDQIGILNGMELDQAFGEGIKWLSEKVGKPYDTYRFIDGDISVPERNRSTFEITRRFESEMVEKYVIHKTKGLVEFEKKSNPKDIQSSVLGTLHFEKDHRYFVELIRKEEVVSFGPPWLEGESKHNVWAKVAVEQRKRAALRVIEACKK